MIFRKLEILIKSSTIHTETKKSKNLQAYFLKTFKFQVWTKLNI